MFMKHPSTFHPIIVTLQAVVDPSSAAEAATASGELDRLLAERFREETAGETEGPFRQDYASARLDGALDLLEDTRRLAVQAGACTEFLVVVDRAIKEAREALYRAAVAAAPPTATTNDKGPEAASWAKAELTKLEPRIPEFLKDI